MNVKVETELDCSIVGVTSELKLCPEGQNLHGIMRENRGGAIREHV